MKAYGDLRNSMDIELARAKGGYLDTIPEDWIGSPDVWLEPKYDGFRATIQWDLDRNWVVSRNRHDKLKGVAAAGEYVERSDKLPHLRNLVIPELAGLMLDGELVCVDDERGRGASIGHYMKEAPEKLAIRAFDLLFDAGARDMRTESLLVRRKRLEEVVKQIGSDFIRLTPTLHPTMAEIEKLWADGWEGGILKDRRVQYRGTNAMKKCKAEQDVDAFCLEPVIARRGGSPKRGIKPEPTGRAGGFVMGMRTKDGRTVKVGTMMMGVTDEDKERGIKHFDREFLGRVARMSASGYNGVELRWCRFKNWHEEAGKPCILEDQIGPVSKEVEVDA